MVLMDLMFDIIIAISEETRRKRRASEQFYLRLTEIELQVLQWGEAVQDNARNDLVMKFKAVKHKATMFMQKYSRMDYIVLTFRIHAMETEKLEIIEEIDHLLRMLSLIGCTTAINRTATAEKNVERMTIQVEHVRSDFKLVHDQISKQTAEQKNEATTIGVIEEQAPASAVPISSEETTDILAGKEPDAHVPASKVHRSRRDTATSVRAKPSNARGFIQRKARLG